MNRLSPFISLVRAFVHSDRDPRGDHGEWSRCITLTQSGARYRGRRCMPVAWFLWPRPDLHYWGGKLKWWNSNNIGFIGSDVDSLGLLLFHSCDFLLRHFPLKLSFRSLCLQILEPRGTERCNHGNVIPRHVTFSWNLNSNCHRWQI